MLHFKEAGCHKYALEALKLQLDLHAVQSPRVAHRLMWNHTVNTAGGEGKNIALDLNCEHYIRYTKVQMQHQGANVKFEIAEEMSKITGGLNALMQAYDADCLLEPESGMHTIANCQTSASLSGC
ncbi:hypothetical protein ABVT39_001551 [Epinephelus coioides]